MSLAVLAMHVPRAAADESAYELEPIAYSKTEPTDPIARLQKKLDVEPTVFRHDDAHGYLLSVLKELKIPISSQSLVFSKTSFQRDLISPRSPRALYFNDDVYVGWVKEGEVLEVATADPQLGVNFYTLDQRQAPRPHFVRQTESCLQCHAGSMTRDLPGLMVRSVFPDRRGLPILSMGTRLITDESPMKERWGGWYVTGAHGSSQPHRGNVVARDADAPDATDFTAGANVTSLAGKFDTSAYLTGHSDIAALMVLEHQTEMHNRLVRANYQTRFALRDEKIMNAALDRPADYRSESTVGRIKSAGEPLLKYMLFCGEAPLSEPVKGTSGFARDYAAAGLHDSKGRSLRELDLNRRLLKYPCSPLIYSESFEGLPEPVMGYVYQRLFDVLTGKETGSDFAHLSRDDRRAILEILLETKKGLPAYWTASP